MVELMVVLMPILLMCFCFAQVAFCAVANLAVRHAAVVATRTAIVVSSKNKNQPGDPGAESDIRDAAILALSPWSIGDAFTKIDVKTEDNSSLQDPYGPVTVTVKATYKCRVPLASVVCGGFWSRGQTIMKSSATLPHQGARYQL